MYRNLMGPEVRFVAGAVRTILALEGFLPRVDTNVLLEMGLSGRPIGAHGALETPVVELGVLSEPLCAGCLK